MMPKPDYSKLTKDNVVDFIADIFARRGAEEYLGEDVTISEHMFQTAELAEESDASEELIVAALLHDIGHFTNEFPDNAAELGIDSHHDRAGATVLAPFFPKIVTDCVRHHVSAKRYLCTVEPEYFSKLSDASILSLKLQGGPMSESAAKKFAANGDIDAIVQVRKWDDIGKVPGKETPGFSHYAPMLQRVVDSAMKG
ncbi:HD domain-containing protein [Sneathiella sp. HT1-7]|jgi:phosphonate degradation associated HDIG domain protein|uniref:(R)-1-hydroxy-2-trimethylaminoethylphosphonate oxygenase n=1 Tax=Sneathiella sp. HT1-7 TaxID=2887192 RepID=UPI001D14EA73|nr:HD domain-containing protein [Sneathiella sp. HT1-7]MCC3306303.1 HD domain-containing protein [Sneathiella sp. HT1-7]